MTAGSDTAAKAQRRLALTGVTGGVGGRVARLLAAQGLPLRLIVRDPSRAPGIPADVAVASYADPGAVRDALAGVDTLLFVSAAEAPDRLGQHRIVVDAAAEAGVGHVVYLSFLAAAPDATFTFARDHWHTEDHVRARGLAHTFLRDSLYLDMLPYLVGDDGVIRGPAGDGRFAPVARDDVARVATAVLTDPARHSGMTYDLTGVALVTLSDVALQLSELTGRAITYQAETLEEAYASRASHGAPEWEVTGWVTSYAAIAAGELDVLSDNVERITGRVPLGVDDWLKTNPQAWRHLMPEA